jgi:hypothetical protein
MKFLSTPVDSVCGSDADLNHQPEEIGFFKTIFASKSLINAFKDVWFFFARIPDPP